MDDLLNSQMKSEVLFGMPRKELSDKGIILPCDLNCKAVFMSGK